MRNSAVNAERLLAIGAGLGEAVVDPSVWPNVLEQIGAAAGATGAALFRSDIEMPEIPRSTRLVETYDNYFATGWYRRDTLAERGLPLLQRGFQVISDQDIVTADEMKRLGFYNEVLVPFGLQWFAAVGFMSGSALWATLIIRSPQQGPFEQQEKRALALLSQRLTETATLSKAVGRAVLSSVGNALHLVGQPALVLDRLGFVLDANASVEQIFDDEVCIRNRRLMVRDRVASAALSALTDRLCTTTDSAPLPVAPIVVRRGAKQSLLIRILPIDGAARTPFLGARALLVFSDLDKKAAPRSAALAQAFRLSPAEARLASLMATGVSVAQASEQLGVSPETIRTQLKAIFAKTGARRQSELVLLLSRF